MPKMIFFTVVISLATTLPAHAQALVYDDAMKYLQSADPKDRALGLVGLALLGKEAAPASREIILALNDPDAEVRKQAAAAIGAANPTLAKPVLAVMSGDGYDNRVQAMQDLSKLGKDAAPAVPALIGFLNQAKDADKAKVIEALAKIGATDKRLTAKMTEWALTSTDPAVRAAALKALPNLSDPSAQVETVLKSLQNERTVQGRINAINVLASVGKDSREARQVLQSFSTDANPQVREAAKKALAGPKDKK